jgi:hypothetical protein
VRRKHITDVVSSEPLPEPLPTIDVSDGDLGLLTSQAVQALQAANNPPVVYRYGDGLAWIVSEADQSPRIQLLTADRLRHRMARVAQWIRTTRSSCSAVAPPLDVVKDVMVLPDPPFPVLKHLTFAPYITASGALHLVPGYHPESQIYYAAREPLNLPSVSLNPTPALIAAAIETILDLLVDFPFAGDADRAHAVALLLLPFGEQLFSGPIPAHAVDKPTPGSGGGLLMDISLYPALGGVASKMTEAADNAEWRRIIHAKLIEGSLVVGFDNIHHRPESAALTSALTEAVVEDRVIRTSVVQRATTRRIWVFVGNNLTMSPEIQRRTIRIRLDPGVDRPELRTQFRHPNLRERVKQQRSQVIHAALTLWQAWLAAGRPLGNRIMGSFEGWAQTMGGVLGVAGIPGFLGNVSVVSETADPAEVALRGLVQLWWDRLETREAGVSDLWKMVDATAPDLLIALDLRDRNEAARKTLLGLRLNGYRDRVFDGLKLVLARQLRGANRWKLVKMRSHTRARS